MYHYINKESWELTVLIFILWQQVDQDDVEKKIKTAAELARWDESKKWQHKIEILKNRLTEADGEVSKLSKTNNSLRYSLNKDFLFLKNFFKNVISIL